MKLFSLFKNASPIALLAFMSLLGCGGAESAVKGTVTHNGQPVKNGNISFTPEGGTGTAVGGEITDGKFAVKGVTPGKYRVKVSSYTKGSASDNMDEAIKAAKAAKKSNDEVAATDDGNNQLQDVVAGADLNLALKTATGSGGRSK
ncbi:carboxypeptidase-like regulatory domain-containing protein [Zavarzinella formosa]|uniref:carboxypeptidase-like regulatory domain-containing protein n=1 Tax=Zavarzinella formosa TaxID=360055 RepID=UPI0002E9D11B|nr:carboxypeptidase-like regulatory domain-containing protein [Zavarzinella formosa]